MAPRRTDIFLFCMVACTQCAEQPQWHGKINTMELVVVDGKNENDGRIYSKEVGFRLQKFRDAVPMVDVAMSREGELCDVFQVAETIVKNFMIKPSSIGKHVLTDNDRSEIRARVNSALEKRFEKNCIMELCVCFGKIGYKFGLNGCYFVCNLLLHEFSDKFDEFGARMSGSLTSPKMFLDFFHFKHVKFRHAPFDEARSHHLVKIKQLKDQNDTELHRKAKHLSNSYGQIMRNLNPRINNKDQMEYPVESLSDPEIGLRLRRKYLRHVSNVIMHKVNDYPFPEYRDYVQELLNNPNKEILVLPHVIRDDMIYSPKDAYALLMFQLRNERQYKNNLIRDIGVESWPFFYTEHDQLKKDKLKSWIHPFGIDKKVWEKAIDVMKKTMSPDDRQRHKALLKLNNELFDVHYQIMMKASLTDSNVDVSGEKVTEQCTEKMKEKKILKTFEQYPSFYVRLFHCVRHEILERINEQHPCYADLYTVEAPDPSITLTKLHTTSIFANYVAANTRGHDLHVFYTDDGNFNFLSDVKPMLAKGLQQAWKIATPGMAEILANEIVVFDDKSKP